jgi:hypothetical protein
MRCTLSPVEIYPIQDAIVLRARGSELLILADHVTALKKLKAAGDFSKYFLNEALVNRPARKLFEAWLRKDGSLWARIYKSVQTIEPNPAAKSDSKAAAVTESIREATKEPKKAEAKAPAKAAPKKAEAKAEPKKDAKKPAAAKSEKATEKKSTAKPAAKSVAKPAAKPAGKTAAKPAAKKSTKK